MTWVRFTVNTVSATTYNVGLAELQVFSLLTFGPAAALVVWLTLPGVQLPDAVRVLEWLAVD